MEYIIQGQEPRRLFEHFEELSAIPRSSGEEKAASDFLMDFASAHGLEAHQDDIWDVVIKKPGSAGCEALPPVMLQGHIDMVCEKRAGVAHDFSREGIRLIQEGNLLRADGTTLGGDNGVAVAMMLTILEDGSLVHPPLECVFTVQEETGLAGAAHLDPALLSARTMINLDSEEEGVATVSCAGGMRADLVREFRSLPCEGLGLLVQIRGLLGGHSGADIHLERGNANKLMGRLLGAVYEKVQFQLCSLEGGNKDNAIPREADALIALPNEAAVDAAISILNAQAAAISAELDEPDFRVNVEPAAASRAMDPASAEMVLSLLRLAPNGVLNRNVKKNFVVRSINLGVVRTGEDRVIFTFAPRSSSASLQEETRRELRLLAALLGCSMTVTSEYPGWSYAERSPIREAFRECCRELTGKELVCEAIHAGLECGLFSEKLPGLDAIAIGPVLRGVHTPDETLEMDSLSRVYGLLVSVLERLTK